MFDAKCARIYYHYASDEMGSITHVVDSEEGNVLNHYECSTSRLDLDSNYNMEVRKL